MLRLRGGSGQRLGSSIEEKPCAALDPVAALQEQQKKQALAAAAAAAAGAPPPAYPADEAVPKGGAAKAGVTVEVLGDGASAAELEKALSGARALLFSPTLLPEEGALKTVRTLIPELEGLPERADQLVYSAKFPNLRWVFNTGFERVPGMLKFEYILAYKKENPTTASMGSIAFAGPGSKKDLSIPYLDPEAKTPVVEPSREVA